jgi:hypothetical protein
LSGLARQELLSNHRARLTPLNAHDPVSANAVDARSIGRALVAQSMRDRTTSTRNQSRPLLTDETRAPTRAVDLSVGRNTASWR